MKQITRYSIAIATLLLMSMGAWAAGGFTVNYQLDGESTTATVGEVTYSNGTITVTPADGYYLTAEDLKVIKTIDGQYGQTRTDPSIDATVAITATDANADPSGVTTYTFTVTDEKYDYEITANFHSRKDVAEALIALPEDAVFVYSGEAIEPAVSVTYAGEAMTADKDYTVEYANNINVGLGDVTITGIGIYKGTKTVNFDINQASVAIRFESADGSEAKELTTVFGAAFTEPILKLDPAGAIEVNYSVDNEEIATVDAATGKLTILKTGTVVVTATAKEDYTNKEGSNYNANPTNTKASYSLTITTATPTLKFSAETATATMGTTFVAPTLTVTPEGLAPIEYESTNTEVATVDKNTGVVTLVGKGEATIKAVFPGNENYETALASYILTVSKATATLKFSAETATAIMGAEFAAPTLTVTPEGLQDVKYSSSNTNVATVNETTGVVTLVGAGEAVIKASFAGTTVYEAAEASYTLTVSNATMNVTATGYEGNYDGKAHGITVKAPEGATVKYGTEEGKYDLTESPAYTDAGTYTVYYQVTKENTETVTGSAKVTITKGSATLKFSAETATATMGTTFVAPTLTVTPEGLQDVKYSSSNTNVATVNETTGVVTLVGAGEAVIKASFAGTTVYEAAEASYVLTVSKAKTELKFSSATATATMNAEFEAPILTKSPENLEGVEFTSSNEAAATVDKTTGAVTLVGAGETTIKAAFTGSTVYEASEASYTLTVNRAAGEGYLLWVNDTQVTSDNAEDVLGHKTDSSKPYYIYNKDKKQLYMDNDQTRTTVIESRMPELTVYIKDANKIKRIFFNNTGDASNKGNLTFTTNGNFPGKLIIANPTKGHSAIKGFSNISYNWDLTAIEPDGSYYDTTTLEMKYKKETDAIVIADTITIGEAIVPITEKRAITFEESQLVEKDEDGKVKKDESGNPIKANLSNYSYAPSSTTGEPEKNVIHISLNSANIGNDAGGFDIENGVGGIYIEDTMTDEKAGQVAQDVNDNKMVPGGTLYAESYDGFTFKLIAGSGTIEIDEIVENDHEFHLIIGTNKPITLNGNNSIIRPYDGKSVRVQAEIAFNVGAPTYCFLYMVKKTASTRLGKRDKAHGKLVSVQVRSTTVIPTEPPSEATGGVIPKSDDPEPETDPTPPTGITFVNSDKMAVKSGWYTIDGQKIAEPTQRGLYIKDGKKVVIK